MAISVDTRYLTRTLEDLVRINSVNPNLAPDGPGENEVAQYVSDALREIGMDVSRLESASGRPSIVGTVPGMGGSRSLMLNAHYDTVGVEGMSDPFSAEIVDGKLYGRGSYDMKGSLAACMTAVKALQDASIGLAGDVIVAAVADEEHGSIGALDVIEQSNATGVIVTEPTELDICLAHKGFIWLEIEVTGKAAHGSRPDLGLDANMHMGRVLVHLEWLAKELAERTPHRLVGAPSLHAAVVRGGTAPSVYSANCKLTVERRTIPGETEQQIVREIQSILDDQAAADPEFHAELKTTLVRDPFEVSSEAPIVKHLERAVTKVTEAEPIHGGQTPWMDAALFAAAGMDTVVIGPAGAGAHSVSEWVDIESVDVLARILAEAALEYCG